MSSLAPSVLRKCVECGAVPLRTALMLRLLFSDTLSGQVRTVADDLDVNISRVSMLGKMLEEEGLVSRCVPASDLRKVSFALTETGKEKAQDYLSALSSLQQLS